MKTDEIKKKAERWHDKRIVQGDQVYPTRAYVVGYKACERDVKPALDSMESGVKGIIKIMAKHEPDLNPYDPIHKSLMDALSRIGGMEMELEDLRK